MPMANKHMKKMLNIANYQRNENQSYNEVPSEWPPVKCLQITNAGEGVEKSEPSNTVGGNISWYRHSGKEYGGS